MFCSTIFCGLWQLLHARYRTYVHWNFLQLHTPVASFFYFLLQIILEKIYTCSFQPSPPLLEPRCAFSTASVRTLVTVAGVQKYSSFLLSAVEILQLESLWFVDPCCFPVYCFLPFQAQLQRRRTSPPPPSMPRPAIFSVLGDQTYWSFHQNVVQSQPPSIHAWRRSFLIPTSDPAQTHNIIINKALLHVLKLWTCQTSSSMKTILYTYLTNLEWCACFITYHTVR